MLALPPCRISGAKCAVQTRADLLRQLVDFFAQHRRAIRGAPAVVDQKYGLDLFRGPVGMIVNVCTSLSRSQLRS